MARKTKKETEELSKKRCEETIEDIEPEQSTEDDGYAIPPEENEEDPEEELEDQQDVFMTPEDLQRLLSDYEGAGEVSEQQELEDIYSNYIKRKILGRSRIKIHNLRKSIAKRLRMI